MSQPFNEFIWHIDTSEFNQWLEAANQQKFESAEFKTSDGIWYLRCYPNGRSKDSLGNISVYLQCKALNNKQNDISYCVEFSELNIKQSAIHLYSKSVGYGWQTFCSSNILNQINSQQLTIKCTVHKLHKITKNNPFKWVIGGELLKAFKAAEHGAQFDSIQFKSKYGTRWSIEVTPNGFNKDTVGNFGCYLSYNEPSSLVSVQYGLKCVELEKSINFGTVFDSEKCSWGTHKLFSFELIKDMKQLTIECIIQRDVYAENRILKERLSKCTSSLKVKNQKIEKLEKYVRVLHELLSDANLSMDQQRRKNLDSFRRKYINNTNANIAPQDSCKNCNYWRKALVKAKLYIDNVNIDNKELHKQHNIKNMVKKVNNIHTVVKKQIKADSNNPPTTNIPFEETKSDNAQSGSNNQQKYPNYNAVEDETEEERAPTSNELILYQNKKLENAMDTILNERINPLKDLMRKLKKDEQIDNENYNEIMNITNDLCNDINYPSQPSANALAFKTSSDGLNAINNLSAKLTETIPKKSIIHKNWLIKSEREMLKKTKKSLSKTGESKTAKHLKYYTGYLSDEFPIIQPCILFYIACIENLEGLFVEEEFDLYHQIILWGSLIFSLFYMTYIGYLNSIQYNLFSFIFNDFFYINYLLFICLIVLTSVTPANIYMTKPQIVYTFGTLGAITFISLIIIKTNIILNIKVYFRIIKWRSTLIANAITTLNNNNNNYKVTKYPNIEPRPNDYIKNIIYEVSEETGFSIKSVGFDPTKIISDDNDTTQGQNGEEEKTNRIVQFDEDEFCNGIAVIYTRKGYSDEIVAIKGLVLLTNKNRNGKYKLGGTNDYAFTSYKIIDPPSDKYGLCHITLYKNEKNQIIDVLFEFVLKENVSKRDIIKNVARNIEYQIDMNALQQKNEDE